MNNCVQAVILCTSAGVAFLLGSSSPRMRRVGFILGILGQPFWFYSAWDAGQWAVMALAVWYGFCHSRGLWNTLEKPTSWVSLQAKRLWRTKKSLVSEAASH